jgi:spore germination cell wall hydrolase CwlJ-like protein
MPIPTTDPTVTASPQAPSDQAEEDYASLSAAVAAQEDADANPIDDDLSCMAGAVYFEAKGEPLSGQLAVAQVILNRTKSGRFPKSACSVVKQRGQFSFVRRGRIPAIAGNRAYRTAVAVARVAMAESWDSPAADAMYFHTRRVSPGWHLTKVAAIGNHVFYR